ncbi:MAG TPA: DNA primase [Candidatus Kapabacteria bacterium]|jgi:DNA primase|nr:DNA primase [Candidatus Kapabacteria bacterium]
MKFEEIKQEILERSDIVEIISESVYLKKVGKNFVGLCPFHSEKTPSFNVSPEKKIYKCFGCGRSGNVFTFLMENNGMTFREAMNYLAKRYGIAIDATEEDKEKKSKQEDILNAMEEATNYYQSLLKKKSGTSCLEYLERRGISQQTIEEFRLGYSTDSFNEAGNYLRSKGYNDEILLDAGLLVQNEKGNLYDRFRGRAMFPITDIFGRVIAFGARSLNADKSQPKYINSPQTMLYDKSSVLYGLSQAKSQIINKKEAILVEGYMDVITMHQWGYKNAVASSGTSLTAEQLKLLSRYTKNLNILYDADEAGQNAAERAIEIALQQEFDISIITLPEGEDPDSILREQGPNAFRQYLDKKLNFIEFLYNKYKSEEKLNSPKTRIELARKILEYINLIPDMLLQDEYVKILIYKMDFIGPQVNNLYTIKNELAKTNIKKTQEPKTSNLENEKSQLENNHELIKKITKKITPTEKSLLRLILENEESFDYFKNLDFNHEILTSTQAKRIIEVVSKYNSIKELISKMNEDDFNPILRDTLTIYMLPKEAESENWSKYNNDYDSQIRNYAALFKSIELKLKLDKINQELKSLQKLLRKEDLSELELISTLEHINENTKIINEITRKINEQ